MTRVEDNYDKNIVDKLNTAACKGVYEAGLWAQYTAKTADQLWDL